METDTKRQLNNGKKLAWFLIAFGLLAGGISGIFQEPPGEPAKGWSVRITRAGDFESLVIPDQDDDGVDDYFYFVNPSDYNYLATTWWQQEGDAFLEDPLVQKWNMRCGVVVVSGATGNVISEEVYSNSSVWCLQQQNPETFKMVYAGDNKVLLFATPVDNVTKLNQEGLGSFQYDNFHFLHISLDTLAIVKQVNITANGWESAEYIKNQTMSNPNWTFWPRAYFLKNVSIPAPGDTVPHPIVAYLTDFPFWNETLQKFEDYPSRRIFFVDAMTLTLVSNITWDFWNPLKDPGNYIKELSHGFCKGPSRSNEKNNYLPYFYLTYLNQSWNGLHAAFQVALARIDALSSDRDKINWTVVNFTAGTFIPTSSAFNRFTIDSAFLSTAANGSFAGLTIYQEIRETFNSTFPEEDKNKLLQYFHGYGNDMLEKTIAYRVACISLVGVPQMTFYSEGRLPSMSTDVFGINSSVVEGVCKDVIHVGFNDPANETTTVALLFSDESFLLQRVRGQPYVTNLVAVKYLKVAATGTTGGITGDPYALDDGFTASVGHLRCAISKPRNTFIPVDFDIDGDNMTDIPLPGTIFNVTIFNKVNVPVVNGPYLAFTSQSGVIQEIFLTLYSDEFSFTKDINGDNIGDCHLKDALLYTQTEKIVQQNFVEARLSDDTTKTFFITGIILAAASVLIFIGASRIKTSSLRMEVTEKKRPVTLIIFSMLLVLALYILLNNVTSAIKEQEFSFIGTSPEATALESLIRISGFGTFVFLLALPVTLGLYMFAAAPVADGIVLANQVFFAKLAGLRAIIKKEPISKTKELAKVDYRIVIVPPFGRNLNLIMIITRTISVLALSTAMGLYVFNFLVKADATMVITSISDEDFVNYITSLFLFLIVPGIASIPVFFWLFPSTWLLDDAGVLYYLKRLNNRHPEDVESVGGWFSNYLKGFLGISAFINYIEFVLGSPVLAAYPDLGDARNSIVFFVFGFIVVAGITFGLLTVALNELVLPYSAARLYKRLADRHVDVERKTIEFGTYERLDPDHAIAGFLGKVPRDPDPAIIP